MVEGWGEQEAAGRAVGEGYIVGYILARKNTDNSRTVPPGHTRPHLRGKNAAGTHALRARHGVRSIASRRRQGGDPVGQLLDSCRPV
jgi:hypothetical protein